MQYNTLTGTNIKVSILSLGTMMFGKQTTEIDSLQIMDYAYEHGINLFDTANVYNGGESEKIVGKGLKGRREKIILATKVRYPMGDNPNDSGLNRRHIIASVEASLKRLDTDYIDIYYMHAPDNDTSLEESLDTMTDLVKSGKIRYIGVSNYAAWQIADIHAICQKNHYIPPIITQNVYNPITRGIENELIPFLKAHKMAMTIYNPIAAGLLAGKHKPGAPTQNTRFSNDAVYYDRYWSDENFTAIEKLMTIASGQDISILELTLKWCIAQPSVTTIITGVSRLSQIEQNIASIQGEPLSAKTLAECDAVWLSLAGTRFGYNR
ncbi:MAG: aldo/keto reductase [Vallitaleaceae bacterium]|jgi:aryl-alcohol dehydrogenase-like predicted oxidoreductase|nr:aldo/keto reductase [Vallitaleaceae bacterium]